MGTDSLLAPRSGCVVTKASLMKFTPPAAGTGINSRRPEFVPCLIFAVFLTAIVILPYYFPVPGPNGSASWEFGFSNTAAAALAAGMLLALFGWRLLD